MTRFKCLFIVVLCCLGLGRCDELQSENGDLSNYIFKIGAIFDKQKPQVDHFEKAFLEAIKTINGSSGFHFEGIIEYIEYDNPFDAMTSMCFLLEEGVVGILGPVSEDNSNIVQSICDAKEIPHIEVRWDDLPLNGTIVNVYPYPDVLTRTYLDILDAWDWEEFVILYENNESLKRVFELLKLYDNKGHKIIVRQLDKNHTGNFRPTLKEIWRAGATHFLLDCSIEILEEVLRQAQQVGLMTNKHHYIITNLDLHTIDLTPFQYSETNITGMRFIDPESLDLQEVAARIYDDDPLIQLIAGWKIQLEVTLIYDAILMFAEAFKQAPLVPPQSLKCKDPVGGWTSGQTVVNLMKGLDYPGLTGKIKFDNRGYRSNFGLEVIELREGGVTKIGTWNSSEGLNITRIYPPGEVLDDQSLVNKSFIVITCLTEPYGMLKESATQLYGNDRFEGFAIDLIHELALMEGFNYTFKIREDKKNGAYDPYLQKWTGMIGDLIDNNADLAITDLTITSERAEAVDFTSPFMNLGISILFQKPKKAPPSFFSFADPFALEVWKLLAAAYFGVSIALFIIGRLSPGEWTNPYPCIEEPEFLVNQLSLRNCFWFNCGAIMQQGSEIAPLAISTRMVAGMWWFFTLIMVSSYTANLAAFLTTEAPDTLFTNVHELVKYAEEKGIKYGAKANGATANFFRDSKHIPDYQKIYEYMEAHKDEVMVQENKDGVEKAEKELYAFFMESTSIEYETQRRCNLAQVGGMLDEKGYGIAVRKNSSYRNNLSSAILKLQESGRMADLKRRWWEERRGGGQCQSKDDSSAATPLNLKNVGGVFWVTIGGTVLSCIFVFLEMLLHIGKKSVRNKTSFKEALKKELKFYFQFSGMVKPVYIDQKNSSSIAPWHMWRRL